MVPLQQISKTDGEGKSFATLPEDNDIEMTIGLGYVWPAELALPSPRGISDLKIDHALLTRFRLFIRYSRMRFVRKGLATVGRSRWCGGFLDLLFESF